MQRQTWYWKHFSELDRLDMIGSRRRPILRSWTFDACSYGSSKSDFNSRFYKLQILIQDLKIIFKLKFRKKCKQFYIWVWNLGIKNYFWPIAWDLDFFLNSIWARNFLIKLESLAVGSKTEGIFHMKWLCLYYCDSSELL